MISFSKVEKILTSQNIKYSSNILEDINFSNLRTLEDATQDDLSFCSNDKYITLINSTKAKCCILKKEFQSYLPKNCNYIFVENPYLVFSILTHLFFERPKSNGCISKNAYVNTKSIIKENVQINHGAIIKENATISKNVIISENTIIGPNVLIGENTVIESNCTINNAILGNNCRIKSSTVIGGDGFGFVPGLINSDIIHNGNVVIEDNVNIGSNCSIDRATLKSTIVGINSRIDNLVQIAHNVVIGKNAIIAAQVGIAGSTILGNNVIIGGQAGIAGHIKIGNNVNIAAKSGVTKNIDDHKVVAGFPAIDIKKWKLNILKVSKMK